MFCIYIELKSSIFLKGIRAWFRLRFASPTTRSFDEFIAPFKESIIIVLRLNRRINFVNDTFIAFASNPNNRSCKVTSPRSNNERIEMRNVFRSFTVDCVARHSITYATNGSFMLQRALMYYSANLIRINCDGTRAWSERDDSS